MAEVKNFKLLDSFVDTYADKLPPFGFNGLGLLTYMRTYSRLKLDGNNERWHETIRRVVEGTYNIQKRHITSNGTKWNHNKAQKSAQEMYDRMFNMKFLPPGRGLWMMGTSVVEDKGLAAALFNCAFCSTKNIDKDPTAPFLFLMDASMLGVGVGFDTKGAGKITVTSWTETQKYQIPDTREGWVDSLQLLLEAYFLGADLPVFDYSLIRGPGELIKGFGGVSSGPAPLIQLHIDIANVLNNRMGNKITVTDIVDIMNLIGKAVVAGNIRRTAEIAFGEPESEEYLDLKDYTKNPQREEYGWTSNNSVTATLGMDYGPICERIKKNGEPGIIWLDNIQNYSRMGSEPDYKDWRAEGSNPCQPESAELLTKSGITLMKDINIGDIIWSKDGWVTVTNKWETGVKPVYKYGTAAGYFVGTDNHRIVENGFKVEVKDADGIDVLAGNQYNSILFDNQAVIDGLVVGDGTVHKSSTTKVYLIVGENDQDYFTSHISDMFIEKHAADTRLGWKVKTTVNENELGYTYNRVVPDRYFKADSKTVASFLRGLYSANGSICGSRVTLKSTSKRMIEQVQLMLSTIGINSYYTTNKSTSVAFSNGTYTCKESYDLNIGAKKNLALFANNIGFLQQYKNDKLAAVINKIGYSSRHKTTYEIKTIEYLGKETVFDITVDGQSHTYWTGGLNVSNCSEQSLEDMECCCLVETFPANHDSLADYKRTLKFAYLYGKTVTLSKTHWPETNAIMLRNRRIGTSMSGIAQFIHKFGVDQLKEWCEVGYDVIEEYDNVYSDWFAVPKSIKRTSIKPSGTVSLLAGATPGVHYPESRFYIRRMRISKQSNLLPALIKAGYKIEDAFGSERDTVVVEIPVDVGEGIRTLSEVSMHEQLALAAFMQKYWADNQVSVTVTFNPKTEAEQIKPALEYYQYQLKSVSFLPRLAKGAYRQMPYEAITEEEYNTISAGITQLTFDEVRGEEAVGEKYCSNDHCSL